MRCKSALLLLAASLPLLAAGHSANLPGHPAADSSSEQLAGFWRRYLDSDAYAWAISGEGQELLFNIPADPDDQTCTEQFDKIERLLIEHPPYPQLHDAARRCHLRRGDTAGAEIHRTYIDAWHKVMSKDGDGSSENTLLWAATVQDARHYLEYRGERVIDTEYRIAGSGDRILYLAYSETADGQDAVRYFDGNDIVFSIMKAHQRLESSGFRLAEIAWEEAYGGSTALLWLAANKDPGAAVFLGDLIATQGLGNRNNLKSALLAYLWAAENGSAIGATRFARTVFRHELVDLQKDAVKKLASAAAAHYCDAVITLIQVGELRLARKSWIPDLTALRRRCAGKSPGGGFEYRIAELYSAEKGKLHNVERAFDYLRQAAAQGHRDGQWQLAIAYLNGTGTDADPAAGLALLHELAVAGDMEVAVDMGYYLARHPTHQKHYRQPYEYAAQAAAAGQKVGQYNLGVALYYGRDGVAAVNTERAVYWLRQSAEQGYSSAQRALARHLLGVGHDEDVQEAAGLMRAAADQGDQKAQNELAILYETGRGVERDITQARYWYLQAMDGSVAAKINYHLIGFRHFAPLVDDDRLLENIYTRAVSDDPEALTALAIYGKYRNLSGDQKRLAEQALVKAMKADYAPAYYIHDAGTVAIKSLFSTKAPRRSLKSIVRSAELGYPHAHLLLAEYYAELSENNDDEKAALAFRHYAAAAESGVDRAMYRLAQRYEYGIGTKTDMGRAYQWYLAAADKGVTAAKNDIAALMLNGKGTEKDPAGAVKWLEDAASDGVVLAMRNLGHLYRRGTVVGRNIEAAFNWYLKAIEKDDIDAEIRLGEMLIVEPEFGNNIGLARIYLEDAANNGNAQAAFWLARALEIDADRSAAGDNETAQQIEEIYRFAADRGSAPALNNLAVRYLKSGKSSQRKGRRLLEKAAAAGNKFALANLAYCYEHGLGSTKDFDRALALYRESAAAGSPFALKRLSELYSNQDSVLYDPEVAADYARRLGKALLDYYTLISISSLIDPLESHDGRAFDFVEPGIS